jgi:hypothetical protein
MVVVYFRQFSGSDVVVVSEIKFKKTSVKKIRNQKPGILGVGKEDQNLTRRCYSGQRI